MLGPQCRYDWQIIGSLLSGSPLLFRKDCNEHRLFYVRLSLTARLIVSIPSADPANVNFSGNGV
jgi:hypothetical protein